MDPAGLSRIGDCINEIKQQFHLLSVETCIISTWSTQFISTLNSTQVGLNLTYPYSVQFAQSFV